MVPHPLPSDPPPQCRPLTDPPTVTITAPVPAMRALLTHSRPLPLQLCLANLGAAQCPRDRSRVIPRSHPEPAYSVEKREREGAHRAVDKQRADKHQDQASGRD